MRSKMYSILKGFVVDFLEVVKALFLLRRDASLQSNVSYAMESLKCCRLVTSNSEDPERSLAHHGTSEKL